MCMAMFKIEGFEIKTKYVKLFDCRLYYPILRELHALKLMENF